LVASLLLVQFIVPQEYNFNRILILSAAVDLGALGARAAQHPRLRVEVTLGLTAADRERLLLAPLPGVPADSQSQAAALRQRRYEAVVSRLGLSREQVILAVGETASQGRIAVKR
ncbi:MAG: hypothetical protein SNJ60_05830, partial [Pseudanabaenaceae cyanobacterium]